VCRCNSELNCRGTRLVTVMVNGVSGISSYPGAYKCAGKFIIGVV